MLQVIRLRACLDERLDIFRRSLNSLGELVHILGLYNGLKIVFENLRKVI